VLYALADRVDAMGISVHDHRYVTRLLVEDGRCVGALAFDIRTGERTAYTADAVVLATGGHTRLWRRSSSRADENTGDGMALALAAGAELADMELVQFHPTGMVAPEDMVGTLVTEAVRGEGGHLLNADGERYMHRYDPERMELSTRDRVALANYTEIIEGRGGPNGGVLLDISHRSREHILQRLPRMYRQFMDSQGLDITRSPMEVAPTAHYSMGGVVVAPETHATSVPGLYAAGEVTSGLHGANRLGGNSLAETVVFGRRAGEAAAAFAGRRGGPAAGGRGGVVSEATIREADEALRAVHRPGTEDASVLSDALREIMWQHGGVVRDEARLVEGLERLRELRGAAGNVDVQPERSGHRALARALDLRAALDTAEATLLGALERRESRGAHQRSDFPDLDPSLTVNLVVSTSDGKQVLSRRPVEPVRAELAAHLHDGDLAVAGRLLE
jgi:succinate dehydrogenase / fumarate reductase flavoprotein subunit